MPLYDPLTDPPQRTQVGHLVFLRESLDRVSERLREGIAESIAHTVANAVRQTVLTLLAERQSSPSTTSLSSRVSRDYRTHLWGEPHEHLPVDDRDGFKPAWNDPEVEPEPAQLPAPRQSPRWLTALSGGWQAGVWCLRSRRGRFPLLGALGVGLVAGVASLVCVTLLPAGVPLVDSALSLATLANITRLGAAILALATW